MNRLRYIPFITWFSLLALANAQSSDESLTAQRQAFRLSENLRSTVAEATPEERSSSIENNQKTLTSGKYVVTQSWSQEKNIHVPTMSMSPRPELWNPQTNTIDFLCSFSCTVMVGTQDLQCRGSCDVMKKWSIVIS